METTDKELVQLRQIRQERCRTIRRFTDAEKRLIVKVYLTNNRSLRQIAEDYGVSYHAIWCWIRKFADANNTPSHPGASHPGASAAVPATDANPTSNRKPTISESSPMPSKQPHPSTYTPEDFERLKQENERLKKQLEAANLMRHISEVMIDEAEKTFNIRIRKKSGTK